MKSVASDLSANFQYTRFRLHDVAIGKEFSDNDCFASVHETNFMIFGPSHDQCHDDLITG